MHDESRETIVFETGDPTELQLARNLLEEAGVPFRVDGGSASSGLLGVVLGSAFAGFHALVVPLEFEARALEVFAAAWPEDEGAEQP